MRIADAFLKCVCFIGHQNDDHAVIGGTAFLVSTESGRVIVTARHVINAIGYHAPAAPVALWFNSDQGIVRVDTKPEQWLSHPEDTTVDVAVLPGLVDTNGFDHLAIQPGIFATDELLDRYEVGIGDVLYFPGLFGPHKGRERLRPIVRQGTISGMPDESVRTRIGDVEAYLVEVRSIGGLSGSPVFLWLNDVWRVVPNSGREDLPEDFGSDMFLGLVHGHYDAQVSPELASRETVNMGISIVIPAQRIREAVEQRRVRSVLESQQRGESNAAKGIPIANSDFESG